MVWTWLIAAANAFMAPYKALLPSWSPPAPPAYGQSDPLGALASKLALVNWLIPVDETLTLCVWLVSFVLPAFIIYTIANWIWRHIPELWGFGPGAG